jgi:periplasmic protein TonB
MSTLAHPWAGPPRHGPTANDRLKARFRSYVWESMIAATMIHFALLQFFPRFSAADISYATHELTAIEMPPEVHVPPPPEQIARPATPVVSAAELDEELTIAPTTFEHNPVEHLPPPPTAVDRADDLSAGPTFTPYTIAPELRNRTEVSRALQRNYPVSLREAGIGGRALVWFYIDVQGHVVRSQLKQTSGYSSLDEAALKVAEIMVFSPAQNRDKRVPVWVALPIEFTTQ